MANFLKGHQDLYMGSEDMTVITEERIERRIHIEFDRVKSFLNGTRDPNEKLHEKWALGFQLELMLKQIADAHMSDPRVFCAYMETTFDLPVLIDADVIVTKPQLVVKLEHYSKYGAFTQGVSLEIHAEDVRLVTGTFLYTPTMAPESISSTGHLYELTKHRARQAAFGLYKDGEDYAAEALGLASNALFQDGRDMVELKKTEGKEPIYFAHKLRLTQYLAQLADQDQVRIVTDALGIKRHNKDRFAINITATKPNGDSEHGIRLYDGELKVKFRNPETQ